MQEEIFGPVVAFTKAKDFNEALEIANNTEYGLTGAAITTNRLKLKRPREEFHVDNLYFNRGCTGAIVGYQPFGGFNIVEEPIPRQADRIFCSFICKPKQLPKRSDNVPLCNLRKEDLNSLACLSSILQYEKRGEMEEVTNKLLPLLKQKNS